MHWELFWLSVLQGTLYKYYIALFCLVHKVCGLLFLVNKWSNFDVIYYEYGALVLVYNNTEKATQAFNLLQEATFDDKQKQLLVLILPNIQVIHHQRLLLVFCLDEKNNSHFFPLFFSVVCLQLFYVETYCKEISYDNHSCKYNKQLG